MTMRLERLDIQGFGAFRDASLGPMGGLTVLVGSQGAGKSTVLEVLDLLRDCLRDGASRAFENHKSFEARRHAEVEGPIRFVFHFSTDHRYELQLDNTPTGVHVVHESLHGRGMGIFEFATGTGNVLMNEAGGAEAEYATFEVAQPDELGLSLLGGLANHVSAVRVRQFFDNAERFEPDPAAIRGLVALKQRAASLHHDAGNLGSVLRDLEKSDPAALQRLVAFVTHYVPGLASVEAREEVEQRVRIWLREGSFREPFPAVLASDGTVTLLAYAALLARPPRGGILCIDEPEKALHHAVFAELVEGLRAIGATGVQVLLVTHSTDLLNAVQIDEAFVVHKESGASTITGVAADETVRGLVAAGDRLGTLWRQNILPGANP